MFFNVLAFGIMVGAIYTLITIGYSMVYGILRLMNFAHGDVYIFGTLVAWSLLSGYGWHPLPALLIAVLSGGTLASVVEFVAYRRLRASQHRMISMITALGAAYIIQNASELKWGNQVLSFPSLFPPYTFSIGHMTLSLTNLITLLLALGVIAGFHAFLKHHKMGKAILCASEDLSTSALMGIPVNRTISIVYFLGGALGVIGGILYSSSYNVIGISMGFRGTIVAFTAAVIGGIGSFSGAFLGSMILGVAENFVGVYVSSSFRDPIIFLFLILILLVKPTGIMGEIEIKKV